MNITRPVIADLWPLYVDGTASADTRALVDEYFHENPEWAATLRNAARDMKTVLPLPAMKPDHEVQVLNRIKRRFRVMRWMLLLAMVFTAQAFGRIVADTSWDVSPRAFIATACVAGAFWIGFCIAVLRCRRLRP
jgi:hypothetical protein